MTKEEKKETEQKKEYKLVNVPTQHTTAVETPDGEILSVEQSIVLLLNKIDEIKSVVG